MLWACLTSWFLKTDFASEFPCFFNSDFMTYIHTDAGRARILDSEGISAPSDHLQHPHHKFAAQPTLSGTSQICSWGIYGNVKSLAFRHFIISVLIKFLQDFFIKLFIIVISASTV